MMKNLIFDLENGGSTNTRVRLTVCTRVNTVHVCTLKTLLDNTSKVCYQILHNLELKVSGPFSWKVS